MTKEELVAEISKDAGITKVRTDKAWKSMLDSVTTSLKRRRKVSFVGFGTFSVGKRKTRVGRNPLTGEGIASLRLKYPNSKQASGLKMR
jgi:DNA-binding protein HU-beta